MKLRFFATILLSLIVTAVAISYLHFSFFQDERLRLIDYQIENSASILISSDFSSDQLEDFDRADEIIHEVFGDDRLNLLVVIYNAAGKAIYKSENAKVLPAKISVETQWQTLQYRNHFIRLLTLPWKNRGLILQVGLVMDDDLLRWKAAARTLMSYTMLLILLVATVAVLLTRTLLKPMRALVEYLHFLSERFESGLLTVSDFDHKTLPEPKAGFLSDRDEFIQLTRGVNQLSKKLRQSVQLTQKGTAQLAHELKTPLTIIRNCLEVGTQSLGETAKQKSLEGALAELDQMNSLVEEFLYWARTENLPSTAFEMHAVSLDKEVLALVERYKVLHKDRIRVLTLEPHQVFARLSFVQQLINNILSNALKYSPNDKPVEISLSRGVLRVRDYGAGLAPKVREKLGEPFNSEDVSGHKGSGLGLAWVTTICRKYGWALSLDNQTPGLMCEVNFESSVPGSIVNT